jgi:hypothetical protein
MAAPTLSAVGERVFDDLAPVAGQDADNDDALAKFVHAVVAPLEEVDELVSPTEDGAPGWVTVSDADAVAVKMLPWLGQFVGVKPAAGLTEAEQRARVNAAAGFRRGTVGAMRAAPEPYLTGTKTVFFIERHTSAYNFSVATLASETADADAVEAALLAQKPAGLVMTYSTIVGGDYATLEATHLDYDEIETDFADYAAIRDDPSTT